MLELPEPEYIEVACSDDELRTLTGEYKGRHTAALDAFRGMQSEYGGLADDISQRMTESEWQQRLDTLKSGPTTGQRIQSFMARLGLMSRPRSVTEELESRLEEVQDRIHAVARLRESLDGHIEALEADIRRLNREVISAAQNEERAAAHVLALNEKLTSHENRLLYWDVDQRSTAAYRTHQAQLDELRSRIRVHGARARGYGRAEERLESIVRMNRNYLEMLKHAAENMEQLAAASHQVVEEIAGNVQALTQLTLANEMANELMASTKELKTGINRVATLASETSLTLSRDIERFTSDMSVYDDATVSVVEANLSEERKLRQQQVEEALAHAWAQQELSDGG